MDGEETNVVAESPAALAKAALASAMTKPNGEVSSTVMQLQAELAALKAKLGPQVASAPSVAKGASAKAEKKAAKLAAKEAKKTAKAEKKAAKAEKKTAKKPQVTESSSMTVSEATAFVASFAGKKGRRPAAFYAAQKIAGLSAETVAKPVKAAKPPKAAKSPKVAKKSKLAPADSTSMTVSEAQAFVASFAGKRGRRPAAFYAAEKLAGVSVEPKAAAKGEKPDKADAKAAKALKTEAKLAAEAEKALAKALKKQTKGDAKAAKLAAKAEKKLASKPKDVSVKPTPSTGQSGAPIKDLTAEDLNDKETVIMLALGTEGPRVEKAIKDLANDCFPNKNKAQANSWARNGLRRLVRAKLLEKDERGVFKQSPEGRTVAKALGVLKAAKK
jgi:hypothetical protein